MPEPISHDDYRPSAEFEQELQELQTQIDQDRAAARDHISQLNETLSDDQVYRRTGFDLASWKRELDDEG